MATGINGIATKEDLYTAFRAFSSASTSKQCPTYAEIIAQGLVVSTTLSSNQLVKYSLISAPAASDPTITVYITNLQAITEYHNPGGIDGDTYFT
jgi:ferritin-like metal-binding protein YciE